MSFMHIPRNREHKQAGVALIMALVFLMLLTILGITAMNTTILQEKMAINMRDKHHAFQAAETALMAGEAWVQAQINKPVFPDNANGLYIASTTANNVWDDNIWSGGNYFTYSGSLDEVDTQPKFIVEDLGEVPEAGESKVTGAKYKGKGKTVLRITARGTGRTDSAQAMVQSTFTRDF